MQWRHPLPDYLEDREEIFSPMIYHLPIIKQFVKVKLNIIHHISWVNSLNNGLFCLESNRTLFCDLCIKQDMRPSL